MDKSKIRERRDPKTKELLGYVDVSVFPFIVYDKDMKRVTKDV
jgi:hypothetical protein